MNNSSGHKTLVPNFKKKYFLWLIVIGDDSKSSFFIQIYLQSSLIKTLRYILKKITWGETCEWLSLHHPFNVVTGLLSCLMRTLQASIFSFSIACCRRYSRIVRI